MFTTVMRELSGQHQGGVGLQYLFGELVNGCLYPSRTSTAGAMREVMALFIWVALISYEWVATLDADTT
jgi:hypothetical protein